MKGSELRSLRGRKSRVRYAAALGVSEHSLKMWEENEWPIPNAISMMAYGADACGGQPRPDPSLPRQGNVADTQGAGNPAGVSAKRTRRKK